ncbi:glycoside hydrolase family 3 C-terminal domain-containing protein [Lachnospiraceae bacterium C1.1]|nr:glycoside hydrolase family 3 C-terminal domain-containing protein [Lachnospiraceae bacterium C1.1]
MRRHSILWTGLASTTAFLLVTTTVGLSCMKGYEGTINQALGIQTSKVVNENAGEDTSYYESEYGELNAENLQKLITDTYDEAVQEEVEGAVLLKNDNNALPLKSGVRVTLFGHDFVQPLYKSSSAGSKGYETEYCIDPYTAFSEAGMVINDTLFDAYKASELQRGTGKFDFLTQTTSVLSLGEEEISFYTDELRSSWENDYNDVAIVMLAREGGEGMELEMEDQFEGISQLALHQQEKDMLDMIKSSGKFKKVIVLVNSGNPMELGWLDDYGVDACLWIGEPGQRGFEGVAKILMGEENPSGHLTDTYAYNSLSSPAVVNGSFNNQEWANLDEVLEKVDDADEAVTYSTVQAEGIYIGYKYYETRYEDSVLGNGNADSKAGSSDGKNWNYANEVQYPFGYGLSYTSFEQKLDKVEIDGDDIKVTATVTNTGDRAGKSAVQVYAQTPYGDYEKENLVEKSSIQLLNFAKTGILEPGESETLTIDCDKYLLASYDRKKAKGYIMSEGEYYITLGDNAHDAVNKVLAAKGAEGMTEPDGSASAVNADNVYNWQEKFDAESYHNSRYTGEEVTNRFEDADPNSWEEGTVTYLSRQDWDATYPVKATQLKLTDDMIKLLSGDTYEKPEDAASVADYVQGDNKGIPLAAMIGLEYDDEKWEEYLNQFTIEELASNLADNFGTKEVTSVGKPAIVAGDGPDGVGGTFDEKKFGDGRQDCSFPTEIVLASTFNKDLMARRGALMAEECLYLGMTEDWMPGVNLHRTPFGGRNFEYYSEDANMNYLCEIPEVEAAEAKGIAVGSKHLIGNDQENNREGVAVFCNEQALREGALRGVEGSLAVAGAHAVMHAYNRIGLVWSSASKALCTEVVENEWGFKGQQETDAVIYPEGTYKGHFATTLEAGVDNYCLDFGGGSSSAVAELIKSNDDGYLLGLLRKSVHDYLYMVANSSAMNGYSVNSKIVSVTPWWKPLGTGLIVLFSLIEIICLIMGFRKCRKEEKISIEEVVQNGEV